MNYKTNGSWTKLRLPGKPISTSIKKNLPGSWIKHSNKNSPFLIDEFCQSELFCSIITHGVFYELQFLKSNISGNF